MSQASEKFCEECGKKSAVDVKFCKFCGTSFPAIDHPEYIRAHTPQISQQPANIPPGQNPNQFGSKPPQQPSGPSNFGQPGYPPQKPPMSGPYSGIPGMGYMRKPPQMWDGGGLVSATTSIYKTPETVTAALLEDPQAPSTIWLIFAAAVTSAILQYVIFLKTNIVEEIGRNQDNAGFFNQYNSADGIQALATSAAIAGFVLVFINWLILSYLLGLFVKGGIAPDRYLQNAPTKSMRQFTGFLYVPIIFRNIIEIILLQFESDREASIKEGAGLLGTTAPDIAFKTDFSAQYFNVLFIAAAIASVMIGYTLYRGLKQGLQHNGSSPTIIAVAIVLYSMYLYLP